MQTPNNTRIDRVFTELNRHRITHTNLNTFANGKGVCRLRQRQHYVGITAHILHYNQFDTGILYLLAHLVGDTVIGDDDIHLVEGSDMAETALSELRRIGKDNRL